jgi:hypothetical protein
MTSTQAVEAFTRFLNEAEIPYMVVGSFSSNYHGTLEVLAKARAEAGI